MSLDDTMTHRMAEAIDREHYERDQPREHRVVCRNATPMDQAMRRHMTWNASGVCDRCTEAAS